MSLTERLGYEIRPQAGFHGWFVRAAQRPPLSPIVRSATTSLDKMVMRGSRGRTTATAILAGLPVLWVTTIGARTGRPHEVPLLGIPATDGDLGLIGSSFGRHATPAWVHNLRAQPEARAAWRSHEVPVRASELTGQPAEEVWDTAIELYPGYADYRRLASHRPISVFRLTHRKG